MTLAISGQKSHVLVTSLSRCIRDRKFTIKPTTADLEPGDQTERLVLSGNFNSVSVQLPQRLLARDVGATHGNQPGTPHDSSSLEGRSGTCGMRCCRAVVGCGLRRERIGNADGAS